MTDQTAMAFACRALRFFGVAEMIERDQLSPAQVASLFAVAASERLRMARQRPRQGSMPA